MSKGTPIPYEEVQARKNNLVTTILEDGVFDETDYDYFSRSPGKLSPKPDDTHRKQLLRRANEHIMLVKEMVPTRLLKTPSQKRSENMRKKLRSRDGYKCPEDYKGPIPLKASTELPDTTEGERAEEEN